MAFDRICVPVALQRYLDFTPVARRQRELAERLAVSYGAALHLLSVDAPMALLPDVETTEEKLQRFAEPLAGKGIELTTVLRQGRPSQEIIAYVEEAAIDLVIIGSHSKRGPLDVGLGSTATVLSHDLDLTVLLVRPTFAEMEQTRELMIPRYPIIFPYG